MEVVYMATIITLLGAADGSAPEARVVPNRVMTLEDCQGWKERQENQAPTTSDSTGKSVLGRFVECVPIQAKFFQDDIAAALAKQL